MLVSDALSRYEEVQPTYIQNELKWEAAELFWLKRFLRTLKSERLRPLKILSLPMRDVYQAHWSVTGIQVPNLKSDDRSVYLPGRNILLLSKAGVFAATRKISVIEIGVLKGNPFSDSSGTFFKKMSRVLSLGLGAEIAVRAPFKNLRKEAVIEKGKQLPWELTFSCMNPVGAHGCAPHHCGRCNKCAERKKAFFIAGIVDRTKYKKSGF